MTEKERKKQEKMLETSATKSKIATLQAEIKKIFTDNEITDPDQKIDSIIEKSEQLSTLHLWRETKDCVLVLKSLNWLTNMPEKQLAANQDVIDRFAGKDPVAIFEHFFNEEIRSHIISESIRYARQQNSPDFLLDHNDLKKFTGILFLTGYHTLPQQPMYWERSHDIAMPIVFQTMSRSRFRDIKRYLHLANNELLVQESSDKLFKVRPLYDLVNKSVNQIPPWRRDFSIDEQMIPYCGRHSAKQTNREKTVRFGYKNFCLTSSDGYPYFIIPYAGAKGVQGTSGKDLTARVVLQLIASLPTDLSYNLAFDNWYSSQKCLDILTSLNIPSVGTVREDRIGSCPLLPKAELKKKTRGEWVCAIDLNLGLKVIKWHDNSVVSMISNCLDPFPKDKVKRWSAKEKKHILVERPNAVTEYNLAMGGVDQLDSGVANYRIKIKGKKWWWCHYTNNMKILMVAAWKAWRKANPEVKDQSELTFIRFIVSRYLTLPSDKVLKSVTTGTRVNEGIRLNQQFHKLIQVKSQRRCAIPSCTSRPRTVCQTCNVALCIPNDHFVLYHTVRDISTI